MAPRPVLSSICPPNWSNCKGGFESGAQPLIAEALKHHPEVKHLRLEDGRGRRLGRTFAVKLWPALIFMKDGVEVARVLRPTTQPEVDIVFNG